jgi:hypothetical protein
LTIILQGVQSVKVLTAQIPSSNLNCTKARTSAGFGQRSHKALEDTALWQIFPIDSPSSTKIGIVLPFACRPPILLVIRKI